MPEAGSQRSGNRRRGSRGSLIREQEEGTSGVGDKGAGGEGVGGNVIREQVERTLGAGSNGAGEEDTRSR